MSNDGIEYIEGNMALAMDVLTFMDLLKFYLRSKLKFDFMTLDNIECYNIVHEGDNKYSLANDLQ